MRRRGLFGALAVAAGAAWAAGGAAPRPPDVIFDPERQASTYRGPDGAYRFVPNVLRLVEGSSGYAVSQLRAPARGRYGPIWETVYATTGTIRTGWEAR
jgi:hypothetical protein